MDLAPFEIFASISSNADTFCVKLESDSACLAAAADSGTLYLQSLFPLYQKV